MVKRCPSHFWDAYLAAEEQANQDFDVDSMLAEIERYTERQAGKLALQMDLAYPTHSMLADMREALMGNVVRDLLQIINEHGDEYQINAVAALVAKYKDATK